MPVSASSRSSRASRVSAPSSRRPWQSLSSQFAEHLRGRLQAGEWKEQLPGERVLAEQLGVSRRTVRAALEELSRGGWLAARSRQGTQLHKKR
ncbi:MAG: GntR family transcriptional regulator, partial [Opitutaceae bacterium]|nr:GntR family transcriptional regulator [Opitutaceae bacterium]